AGDADVGMVQRVENFAAKLDATDFADRKTAKQRKIENRIPGTRKNIASGVPEGERSGRGERVDVEELIGIALARRKRDRLSGDNVRTIGRARVREIAS